jgi:predicted RNA polymerase sigma factor
MQLAEDAVQEAAVAALRTWPRSGMLDEPRRHLCPTWPRCSGA